MLRQTLGFGADQEKDEEKGGWRGCEKLQMLRNGAAWDSVPWIVDWTSLASGYNGAFQWFTRKFVVRVIALCLCVICVAPMVPVQAQEDGQRKRQSRTINQRIAAVWLDDHTFTFSQQRDDGSSVTRRVDAISGEISTLDASASRGDRTILQGGPLPKSQPSALETNVEFVNESDQRVQLFWIDTDGRRRQYGTLSPGDKRSQHTFAGHAWMVQSADGRYYGSLIAAFPPTVARIKATFEATKDIKTPRRRQGWMDGLLGRTPSPDGQSFITRSDKGLRIGLKDDPAPRWMDLELGDIDGYDIVSPSWSPDGSIVAAWKVQRYEPEPAVTIESSPKRGGRAIVKRRPYRLPGDKYDEFELFVFDVASGKRIATAFPKIDFGRPRIHWFDANKLAIEKVDRGHQRVRLLVIDPIAGEFWTAIDEASETFLWTMHGPSVPLFTYLDKTNEVIYASEWSGYRHLYLVDLDHSREQNLKRRRGADRRGADRRAADRDSQAGQQISLSKTGVPPWTRHAITSGDWLVREIERIDEDARTIDLWVGEFYDQQDPYHRHLVRVGIDDGMLTAVTDANGDHSVQYSPNGDFVIASHSRVDSPPVHELRRVSDGKRVCELMRAERLGDDPSRWSLPHVFHAPGRDGRTEIWGNLYFPLDFDPSKSSHYPVIEAIYAGPHGSHVPKQYLHARRFEELTSKGFVVVQIDGMGTANRSKAFHDVCWQNLKDAGFPDRIAWMKAAAKKYPALDLSRVGIFGTSAGGQNACGAVLFHGDFYKAAYASCGCHDNRMDKASWNEQWMGYPVGSHYAANSNIDNADRLEGDLFLVVGELDSNVPPESTYRLVDALVKADKDFEFLMIPGMGHSDGGRYGRRRMRAFFVDALME